MRSFFINLISFFKKHKFVLFLLLSFLIIVLGITSVVIFIKIKSHSFIYTTAEKIPHMLVAIIPGAYVTKNGTLSPVLEDRVNSAIKLYNTQKVDKILVTGDNSTLIYNEVNPVRNYLLNKGVLDQDIFLDHAGFDTYSSMYRAKNIFLIDSAIIVTQSFHLPRAVFTARVLGINALGYDADHGTYLFKNNIREYFANVKAVLNLISKRKPKYLGDEIPINGDGRDNP
ncbi:MAG: YdcF family protein [bacterium]|nr:YdcF family protein [bacterium]